MIVPLYRRLLGSRYDLLPPQVRELHELTGTSIWQGRADVERGRSWPSRMAAWIAGLPPAGRDQPLCVTFTASADRETWSRQFGNRIFYSVQYARKDSLCERVGVVTFVFDLVASGEGLALKLRGLRALGVPVPQILHPAITTFELERDGRYRFTVAANLPVFGLLVRYGGWLERASDDGSAPR